MASELFEIPQIRIDFHVITRLNFNLQGRSFHYGEFYISQRASQFKPDQLLIPIYPYWQLSIRIHIRLNSVFKCEEMERN